MCITKLQITQAFFCQCISNINYFNSLFSYFSGTELTEIEKEIASCNNILTQLKQQTVLNCNQISWQAVLNLLGHVENPCCLKGFAYNEEILLPLLQQANDRSGLHLFYLSKLILCYLFGNFSQAVENAASNELYLDGVIGRFSVFYFYDSLAQLMLYASVSKLEQEHLFLKVTNNQKKLLKWANTAPMNFRHKYDLVEAEKARVLGQVLEAEEFYEQAINGARENRYIQEEALAYELAAKFYLARGREKFAQTYMKEAYYCYMRWGATAKVKDLEVRYPKLLIQPQDICATNTNTIISNNLGEALDLATVMKASLAISGEIVLDQLLDSLMKILIENAGAQTGLLILEKAGEWVIEVLREEYSNTDRKTHVTKVLQSIPIEKYLPMSIVNYVVRTHESVVLNNAASEGNFINEPYIKKHQIKSILCVPLINQSNLVGIVYLENNLAIGAFTQNRVEVLQLLSGQAAIAITNAKLYTERQQAEKLLADYNRTLKQQVAERTLELLQEKEIMQAIIDYIPVMITLYDANGKVQFVNRQLEQFLGWSSREIEEIDLLAEYCLNLKQYEQVLEHTLAATGKWLDFKVKTKNNCYVDTSWTSIRLSNGMLIGIGQDISERKLAEEASILEERNCLARDIHDTLSQDFAIVALHLDTALRKMTTDIKAAKVSIQAGRERTRSGLAEARRSVSALRSQSLEGIDLYGTLNRLTTQMFSHTNIYTVCKVVGEAFVLPKDVENNLLRIGQEALNNAFKYAKASKIWVDLVYKGEQCVLRIKDNGQGFEVGSVPIGSGFGLPGMTERAEYIRAKLTVQSAPGQGTEVVVVFNQRNGV
jgi:PAS domain S-box-containing protein